jgi:IclR family transcriptional regulator, pca regulon regulatory protein
VPDRGKYRIESLAKGLRVLGLFSERRPALRMTELAEASGLPMPTLFRIVATLADEGYLEQLPDGRYRPGSKVLTLGFAALQDQDLVLAATPSLHALADLTKQTVNLGVLSGDRVLYLVRLRNTDELVTANIQVGSTLPAVYGSMGKVLLASLDPAQLGAVLSAGSFPSGAGPNAITSRTALDQQLGQIRQRGYAVQDQEVAYGLRSIAAPVRDRAHVAAAVNIAVQAADYDIERILTDLKQPLLDACANISLQLGHRG